MIFRVILCDYLNNLFNKTWDVEKKYYFVSFFNSGIFDMLIGVALLGLCCEWQC